MTKQLKNIEVVKTDLPKTVRGCVMLDKGRYTILINNLLSYNQQLETLEHELEHIRQGDFNRDADVNQLEYIRHFKKGSEN